MQYIFLYETSRELYQRATPHSVGAKQNFDIMQLTYNEGQYTKENK